MPKPIKKNTLFYGDNLPILRDYIADESIDLIYLDPPFNSSRTYNVLFSYESGEESEAQIAAFEDTWHWDQSTAGQYHELVTDGPAHVSQMISSLRQFIGTNQMMAYLVMMAARLVELYRILKPTGALYLHCDPVAGHYLKVLLDTIFGPRNFVNEIVWKRTSAHSDIHQGAQHLGRVHDLIFFYANPGHERNLVYQAYDQEYVERRFRYIESGTGRRYKTSDMTGPGGQAKGNPRYEVLGVTRYWRYSEERMQRFLKENRIHQSAPGRVPRLKQYLDEMPGVPLQDVWDDIPPINSQARERLGFPTQKPLSLLERIIEVSSRPGDLVLDPFCGCGTTIAAAQKLGRQWVGIDITHLAINLQKYRLNDMFPDVQFEVLGEPESVQAATHLAQQDRFQFEAWATSLVSAKVVESKGKGCRGADKGIDGIINFEDFDTGKAKKVIVQVKSGKVSSRDIRDLAGTAQREKAAIGVFITLQDPSQQMRTEAAAAGFYTSTWTGKNYPRIQILTIEELLGGKQVEMPPTGITFKQAQRVKEKGAEQGKLFQD